MGQSRQSEIRLIAKDGVLVEARCERHEPQMPLVTETISDHPAEANPPVSVAHRLATLLVYAAIAFIYVYALTKLLTTL